MMSQKKKSKTTPGLLCLFTVISFGLASVSWAQRDSGQTLNKKSEQQEERQDASKQIQKSTDALKEMQKDQKLKAVLQKARGVFIVPTYGRAALGVGARGGEGIVLIKSATADWSDPAFYNFGGLSVGAQAGAEGGSIVMILNSEKAVKSFMEKNNFSLSADAGLTVVNWSGKGEAQANQGDVIVWSNAKGLFGSLAIGVQNITFDEEDSQALYGKKVSARDIFTGKAKAPQAQLTALKGMLAGTTSPAMTGGATESESRQKSKSDDK